MLSGVASAIAGQPNRDSRTASVFSTMALWLSEGFVLTPEVCSSLASTSDAPNVGRRFELALEASLSDPNEVHATRTIPVSI